MGGGGGGGGGVQPSFWENKIVRYELARTSTNFYGQKSQKVFGVLAKFFWRPNSKFLSLT